MAILVIFTPMIMWNGSLNLLLKRSFVPLPVSPIRLLAPILYNQAKLKLTLSLIASVLALMRAPWKSLPPVPCSSSSFALSSSRPLHRFVLVTLCVSLGCNASVLTLSWQPISFRHYALSLVAPHTTLLAVKRNAAYLFLPLPSWISTSGKLFYCIRARMPHGLFSLLLSPPYFGSYQEKLQQIVLHAKRRRLA
jgi:hypothetical protein